MKGVVSVLAVAASVAPALALPGWNRGDNNIVNVINEIEHAHPNGGAWGPPQDQWGPPAGNGRRPPIPGQHQSWAKPSAAASDVVVDPASGKAGSGTARPTGYSNVTSSAPYWNNATAPATSYITTYVTVTDVVSTYTSTYQHPVVSTSGSSTSSFNAVTTSTITTSYQSTITVTKTLSVKPAGPGGYGGSEPSTTPVNAVSTSSPAGGNGRPKGGNGSPVSNVIDSSSAVYITVPISQISHATTLAPIPWDGYTPSNYVGLPPKSSSPASPAGGNGVQTTVVVTDYVTTYTTVCPYEKTHTAGGQTSTSTGITTSTVTSSVHTTLTVTKISSLTDGITITPIAPVYGGSSSSSSPASPVTTAVTSGYTTVTTITSVYTTTKPVTSTITSGSSTTTSTGTTTQISTTTVKSTITVSLTSTVTVTPTSSSSSTSPVVSPVTNSGSSSSSVSSSTSSSASGSSSSSASSSTSPISPVTNSASTSSSLSQSSYTTYTTTCSENNTVTIHTHSEPLTSLSYTTSATLPPYGSNLTTTVGPTGSGSSNTSSTVSGPVSGSTSSASSSSSSGSSSTSSTVSSPVTTSESSFTTYTTTCTENGTTTLHTHSAPVYNSTTSTSPVVGPTGGSTTSSSTVSISASYSGNSTSTSPVVGPTGGSTTSSSSTVTGPISYDGNSTTSSAVGPTGTSTSVSESSYTTYTTTCTENGTTTLHTHSAPVTNGTTTIGSTSSTASGPASYSANSTTSSDPVGPTGGSSTSSSTVSGPATYSGNSTTSVGPTAPVTTSSPSNGTSFTTYTTLCTDNGTTTIHTHSAPIYNTTSISDPVGPTGGSTTSSSTVSGPATYSGNSTTTVGPTAPLTTSSSSESSFTTYTTTCTTNGTTEVHTHSAPITANGTTSSTAGPTTTGGSSNIISYSTNSTSSLPTAPITTSLTSSSASLNGTSSQPTAPITTSSRPSASASISSASNSTLSASKTSSSSTASTCKATPTATGKCIPCEGQPGSDPNNFCGYTINDNPYEVMPQTCVTREYNFELVNGTISPDGVPRLGLTVNGQFPGPQVTANWGDTITVHVKNSMASNGSTIHWHGIRQNYTNEMDGVASITQCPIAPGDSMTYTFRASNYGFSWYHAHIAIQSYMGVFGPMVINGPKSVAGSFAEEVVVLNDWSHRTVDEMYDHAQDASDPSTRSNPTMDTGLINGLNVWGADGTAGQTGKRWSAGVQAGETKLFRILNSAIQSTFVFSLDGHQMQVIAADFVPITPYTANTVVINPGQRYDVLITFNQAPANYWFRADIQQDCGANLQWNNIKGIITYSSVQAGLPTSSAWGYSPGCSEELMSNLKPAFAMNAGVTSGQPLVENVVPGANGQNLIKWSLDGVTFQSEWGHPTLESIVHNGTVPPYSGPLAVSVPNLGEWVYIVIESPIPAPHPIHLHGHDFYVLAQGFGTFSSSTPLNLVNPPRRDTVLMPGLRGQAGYVVIAFLTDNPGAWLMHCHIGWHNAMGFALQIIEAQDLINGTMTNTCAMDNTCKKYNEYATEFNIVTNDSGV